MFNRPGAVSRAGGRDQRLSVPDARLEQSPCPPTISSNRPGGGIKWRWPSIHPEGRKFLLIAAIVTVCFWLLGWEIAAADSRNHRVGLAHATVRDADQYRLVIAPADGLVTQIAEVPPPPEIAGADELGDAPMLRIVFMSVMFDVHINRTPVAGTLRKLVYIPGKFVNADLDKASEENERQHFVVERADRVPHRLLPRLQGWWRGAS